MPVTIRNGSPEPLRRDQTQNPQARRPPALTERQWEGVCYVKLNGITLDGINPGTVDVFFCFDTMVHIEPRDIFNYLTRIPPLMRGKRLCIIHHGNMLSERGWARFLREWDKNLMGKRHGRAFSVMTDGIMQRFLDHLGYEVIEKNTTSIPRDCIWILRAPAL